jgi:pimeloyl-ACP methyl ester carboxylesterase
MLFSSKEKYTADEAGRFARLCYGDSTTTALIADVTRSDGRSRPIVARSLLSGPDQQAIVSASPLPIAVVNGANEPIARLRHLDSLHYNRLWKGACQVLDGAGHAPFLQRPGAFNLLLSGFASYLAEASDARTASPSRAVA